MSRETEAQAAAVGIPAGVTSCGSRSAMVSLITCPLPGRQVISATAGATSARWVLTGVYELFGFGFANAGPAVWWSWPVVFAGQMTFALLFAELAGQFPLAGSCYQWSKRIGGPFISWMTGWILIIAMIVAVAAVAVAWQVVLPQISPHLQFVGGPSDAGTFSTRCGAVRPRSSAFLAPSGLGEDLVALVPPEPGSSTDNQR